MCNRSIESVLKENASKILTMNGVVGVAQGLCNNKPCIKVYVVKKKSDLICQIPSILGGYKVMVEETGKFHALDTSE